MVKSSKSQRVKQSDLLALIRIAGEAAELPQVAQRRREHVLASLCELCDADKAVYAQFTFDPVTQQWNTVRGRTQLFRTPASELRELSFFYERNFPRDPVIDLVAKEAAEVVVATPHDYFSDDEWRRTDHFNLVRRPAQIAEQLYAGVMIGAVRHSLGLHRRDTRRFGVREREIVAALLKQAGRLLLDTPETGEASIAMLPPRLVPVLRRLLTGDSEKEAARALGLTPHTIHTYAKHIYRLMGTSSRAELMARFVTLPAGAEELLGAAAPIAYHAAHGRPLQLPDRA